MQASYALTATGVFLTDVLEPALKTDASGWAQVVVYLVPQAVIGLAMLGKYLEKKYRGPRPDFDV